MNNLENNFVEDVSTLDEVVIGYGNQKKSINKSVNSVDGDDSIEPIINATQALQGKAAGVQIIASDALGQLRE